MQSKDKNTTNSSELLIKNKIQYDNHAKKILSYKPILAHLLKYVTEEFKDYSIEEIISCIENPQVGEEFVMPVENAIIGINTEDSVLNEGKIYFDVFFLAYTKSSEDKIGIKLYIDVEAQKDYHPGYDLVTRSLFYCARELSKQYGTEFSGKDYNGIKKVYSIWICMNSPKKYANTITSYRIKPEDIYGTFTGKARYDILESVIIRLQEDCTLNSNNDLIKMLTIIFSNKVEGNTKLTRLKNDFGITLNKEFREELNIMCNLSDLIEEKALRKGEEKGVQKGIKKQALETARKMLDKGYSLNEIADLTNIPVSTLDKLKKSNGMNLF